MPAALRTPPTGFRAPVRWSGRRPAAGPDSPHRSGRLRRAAIVLGLVLLPMLAGLSAIQLAPPARVSDVGLDGLNVEVRVRIGSPTNQIDSALLGGLRSRSPQVLGKHIGLTIRPSAIDLSLFDSKGALDPQTIDVLGHLFGDPQAQRVELHRLTSAVIRYYGTVGLGTGYLVAMLEILGYWYLKFRRRGLLRLTPAGQLAIAPLLRVQRRAGLAMAGVLVLALVLPGCLALSPLPDRAKPVVPDPQLAGTFLAGWQLTGPFTYLIRQAATSVDSLGKTEQRFYDQVTGNLISQYDTRFGPPGAAPDKNLIRLVLLDDLQGTSGMARTVGIAAQRVHADAIVNLGDLTATGTSQEAYLSYLKSYTVSVLTHYAGSVPVFSSLGRHDTPAVAAAAKKLHITVADGTVQKIAGLRFIGVNSPYIVNFGEAARLIDPKVTTDTVAAALRDTGCSQRPFAVFAHDKELLDPLVESGCVPLVIGGHDYVGQPAESVSTPNGPVRRLTLGSTGGHGEGDGLGGLSTPRNNAPFLLLSIDKLTGRIELDTTTVHPDASVSLSSSTLTPLSADQLAQLN
ncbi:MAG TPA: hypothetical protein VFD94_00075 [Jatrophihabitans sp.]|nr:hypothetical protein [Jatrophihabitans sp.]